MKVGANESRKTSPIPAYPTSIGARFRGSALLAGLQGGFYMISGVWPLVAPDSFQAFTGQKMDFWLAQTVGVLIAITGIVLLRAAQRAAITAEIALLAGLQAAALGVVDIYCVGQPGTTPVYLLDAVAEFAIALGWVWAWSHRPRRAASTRVPRL